MKRQIILNWVKKVLANNGCREIIINNNNYIDYMEINGGEVFSKVCSNINKIFNSIDKKLPQKAAFLLTND